VEQDTWTDSTGTFTISTIRSRLDVPLIHSFLGETYWSPGIPIEVVIRAIEHSLPFGIYQIADGQQVGFARVITDRATFAYLADVFVVAAFRGRGLSKWLMSVIVAHPDLQDLRRWLLATRDAHELYKQYGFTALAKPERVMERHDPDVYARLLRSPGGDPSL
jgi:GNAT superfamily N-acetyltransferase